MRCLINDCIELESVLAAICDEDIEPTHHAYNIAARLEVAGGGTWLRSAFSNI